MKIILFCNLPYAFSILKPLEDEAVKRKFEVLWYVPEQLVDLFPYNKTNLTTSIKYLQQFNSDMIFVPGNEVPYFLRGVKVQIFHGLAGEKKGHFRIREYFDLYLTQGPYFTDRFKQLALKYKNFEVIETGWCKLDKLYQLDSSTLAEKEKLLNQYNTKHIILYAPTFSPSLSSGEKLIQNISNLANNNDILVIIKFHDKMDKNIIQQYNNLHCKNLIISNEKDITKLLQIGDLMISDTSSVVYEFVLLNKPVITLNSISENINWFDTQDVNEIEKVAIEVLNGTDKFKEKRQNIINMYHPYNDGKSASRMIDATLSYIEKHGVPTKRKLPLLRKFKMWKQFK